MDCEKCEPLLLDELYGELDELTSAAVRRHVGGCARCGEILAGMRATRKLVSLPTVDVPEGLEDRILAAAAEAQKVVPIRSRMSRAVSWAGAWAMRPQTAMAAVFLLMIGSTTLLLRNNARAPSSATAPITVTQRGAPAAQGATDDERSDISAASSAHGLLEKNVNLPPAPVVAATAAPMASTIALADPAPAESEKKSDDKNKQELGKVALMDALEEDSPKDNLRLGNAGPVAGAAAAPRQAPQAAPGNAGGAGGARAEGFLSQTPSRDRGQADDAFQRGVGSYRAGRFADATRSFDQAAQTGDKNAALWAAKSLRAQSGPAAAAPRFDALAGTDTAVAQEALFEAAECYRQMGNAAAAQQRYNRLLSVAAYAARAQTAIDTMNQVASRKAAATPRAAAPAPAAPPAAKPAATSTTPPAAIDGKGDNAASGF
ncbi:MAG: hypothetical protein JNL38_10560 [Myxococcales bacterium]|nr:hypothetical protein [Myxococcales bacterium]